MSFKRRSPDVARPDPETLARNMVGIGMNLAADGNPEAPIEETLVHASFCGLEESDFRILGVLTAWVETHHPRINADALIRRVSAAPSPRVRAYWAAMAQRLVKDRRFVRLRSIYEGPPVDLLTEGNPFPIDRNGEDPRFVASPLRVPAGALRHRVGDIATAESLVRSHLGYRNRVRMGSTWRSDVWTALERSPEMHVADAARTAGCSFASAWQTARDFALHRSATTTAEGFPASDVDLG